jgi:hypothetical protein
MFELVFFALALLGLLTFFVLVFFALVVGVLLVKGDDDEEYEGAEHRQLVETDKMERERRERCQAEYDARVSRFRVGKGI